MPLRLRELVLPQPVRLARTHLVDDLLVLDRAIQHIKRGIPTRPHVPGHELFREPEGHARRPPRWEELCRRVDDLECETADL